MANDGLNIGPSFTILKMVAAALYIVFDASILTIGSSLLDKSTPLLG